MTSFLEKHYKKIIVAILAFVAVVSVLNAWNDSAIYDETAHIPAGYSYLTMHDMRLNPEHPPMIKDLAALPLLAMDLKFDTSKNFWTTDINGQWDAGHDLLWQEGNDADRIIFFSRLPIIILSILLGLFLFKWTRELAGLTAGLFALVLYSFDPNILGHNHFVTTDIGIAAFMTFSFYYYFRFIKEPTWKNVLIAGIFLALVQLAKFSSIMLLPIFGLATIIYPLARLNRIEEDTDWKFKLFGLAEYFFKGAMIFIISIILVWAVYAVNTYKIPPEKLAQEIEFSFPNSDPSAKVKMTRNVLTVLNGNDLTRPLSDYILGVSMVFKRVSAGNGAYFMGQVSNKAFIDYFPTVFTIKEPLVSIFIMILAIVFGVISAAQKIYQTKKVSMSKYLRENIVSLGAMAFIILYSFISITGNLNIGFRHLFPILPFVYVLTARSIFNFLKKVTVQARMVWGTSLLLLCLALVAGTVSAYPAYMSYFNQVAGGPKNGYHYVTDSNADWGQDLKRLKEFINRYNWCENNPLDSFCTVYDKKRGNIDKIRVNYFGGANSEYYLKDKNIDWSDTKRPLEPGWYAISTNYIMGSTYDKVKNITDSYQWISVLGIKPVYQVGTSIMVFYLTDDDIGRYENEVSKNIYTP